MACVVLSGCGGGGGDASDSASGRTAAPPVARVDTASPSTTPTPGKAACAATGLWTSCAVFERLDRAGLAPRADSGTVAVPPLSAPARRLHVGSSALDVVIYPDAAARERDERRLDRDNFVEYDAPLGMRPLPTLIRSANLIAILHSRNDHQRERVSDAITAGPPQR